MDDKAKKILRIAGKVTGAAYIGLSIVAKIKKSDSLYESEPKAKNPLEGKKVAFVSSDSDKKNADGVQGHLESIGTTRYSASIYEKYVKCAADRILSFGGLVILSPLMGVIAAAIKIEDPGPALFVQKRVGQDKKYFKLHKFRSMKMSTPHDVPTHMLDNPDQYITKIGKFIRKHSLDELPQIWDIFMGNMSVIGPRPALWNQDVLVSERDKCGANDVKPGLTGWAQINGRDELTIAEKTKLDGEYVEKLKAGGMQAVFMDASCFSGSVGVFGGDKSVVEGGTRESEKARKCIGKRGSQT
jgi:lipopolysaccharide/colanic/teichoic acid biosynthesis glycosyltransferase